MKKLSIAVLALLALTGCDNEDALESIVIVEPIYELTLSWVAPVEREDNTALSLSEIKGYHILWGTETGKYSKKIALYDPTATTYSITGWEAKVYYFAVTCIDTDLRESGLSSEIVIDFNNTIIDKNFKEAS